MKSDDASDICNASKHFAIRADGGARVASMLLGSTCYAQSESD